MASFIFTPFGSGGDVNPFVWLGRLLHERGHRVTIIAAPLFADLVERAGLRFRAVGAEADYRWIMQHPDLWKPLKGTELVFKAGTQALAPYYEAIMEEVAAAPAPQQVVLAGPFHMPATRIVREKLGLPMASVHLQPVGMLSAYDEAVFHPSLVFLAKMPVFLKKLVLALPNPANRFVGSALCTLCQREEVEPPKRFMPDWHHSPDAVLCMWPEWFGPRQLDWPAQAQTVGFPLEDLGRQYELPPELKEFLSQGDKPVLFTAGTGNSQAQSFFRVGLQACEKLGKRALLGTMFPEQLPAPLPDWARHFSYLPFSQVLPYCDVMVHHGGIGTLSQGLAAGVPQLIMPMAHDQPDNANRVKNLGCGDWLTVGQFTVDNVQAKLRDLSTRQEVREACNRYSADCRPSGQSERVVGILESLIPPPL